MSTLLAIFGVVPCCSRSSVSTASSHAQSPSALAKWALAPIRRYSAGLLSLILTLGLWMTAIGLGIGIGDALGLPTMLKAFLFGVGSWDPLTLTSFAAILGVVALLACYLPARGATKVAPVVALRYE